VTANWRLTGISADHNWLIYNALYHFYRAAYARFSGGGDRYSRKMELFEDEASKAWSRLIADGIPVVLNPIPCPGAIREFGVGTWGDSNVTAGGPVRPKPGTNTMWRSPGYRKPVKYRQCKYCVGCFQRRRMLQHRAVYNGPLGLQARGELKQFDARKRAG
jgi:hypothetical protein